VQKTWGRLMMLLASFVGADSDNASLLNYQQKHWGKRKGDTCIIELNGLAAVGLHTKLAREKYRIERINTIRRKLSENAPQIVVMYGFTGEKYFAEISGCNLVRGGVVEHQKTLFILADHPVRQRRGNTDKAWKNFGEAVRDHSRKIGSHLVPLEGLKREFSSSANLADGKRIFSGTALGLHLPLNPQRVRRERA
jgi:hypothetical protein